MTGKNKMQLWKYRGLMYSLLLGLLTPYFYFLFLDLLVSYIEIPFAGYLISNYQFDTKTTVYVIMFSLDTLLAISVSLIIAYPLGRIGHGNIFLKIIFYLSAFYLSLLFQEQGASSLNVLIQVLFIPELSVYVIVSSLAMYFGDKDAQRKLKGSSIYS